MRTINIIQTATITKQPEIFNVIINIDSKVQATIKTANEIADKTILSVKTYCKQLGVSSNDIKLLEYKNQPIYKTVEKELSSNYPRQTIKESVLLGHQAVAKLKFSFDFNMEQAGIVFEELSKIENISYQMTYALKNVEEYKLEVSALAVSKALKMARTLANAAGCKVVSAQSITYSSIDTYQERDFSCRQYSVECASAISDLGAEDLSISEMVEVVFKIEEK